MFDHEEGHCWGSDTMDLLQTEVGVWDQPFLVICGVCGVLGWRSALFLEEEGRNVSKMRRYPT